MLIAFYLLFLICLIYKRSSGRPATHPNINIQCLHDKPAKIISCSFSSDQIWRRSDLIISYSMLDRPTEIAHAFHQYFCMTYTDTCRFLLRHQVETCVLELIKNEPQHFWLIHSIIAQRAYESFMLQKFIDKAAISYHNDGFIDYATENLDMLMVKPSPLHFSVIITAHFCPSTIDCDDAILDFRGPYRNWLQQLKEELAEELPGYGTATVVFGSKHLDVGSTDEREFYLQCSEIRRAMQKIPVECIILTQHEFPVEHGHDYREPLAKFAYQKFNSDFYLLNQVNILHLRGWLQVTSHPLLHKGMYNGFGISFQSCPSQQYQPQNLFVESAWHEFPVIPILQRGHFEVFGDIKVFLPFVPLSINNYLLWDIYETFQSAFCNPLFEDSASSLTLAAEFLAIADVYALHVEYVRRFAKRKLEQMKFTLAPLLFNETADIVYNPRDALYPLYCNAKRKCPALDNILKARNSSLSAAKVETVIRQEVYCAAASHSQQGKAICQPDTMKHSTNKYKDEVVIKFARRYPKSVYRNKNAKVAVITAIIGNYETTAKRFVRQTIATDFICFTDREDIVAPGWMVDTAPYHLLALEEELAHNWTHLRNAYTTNQHPFNIAKYYKQQFHHIPLLQQYEAIIWIDGTIEINDENMTAKMLHLFTTKAMNTSMIVFEHIRDANLQTEVEMSIGLPRYTDLTYLGHEQPVQDIAAQYADYVNHGFTLKYWDQLRQEMNIQERKQYGLWCTCFVAWNMKLSQTITFLDAWAMENRRRSTQDQVSFPYVVQKERIHPYSLPDDTIYGSFDSNSMFIKGYHGA